MFLHLTTLVKETKKITKKVPRNSTLKDVRLWLLNSAIFIQIYILKFRKNKNGKLVIKPTFDNNPKNIINIATYSGFKLNPLVNLLIKKSFSFEKNIYENDVGLLSVLNAFIGPVDDAIRDGDTREFSKALEKLSLWHTNLAATLSFEDHNGNLDNWLTLSTGTFFGRSYLDELISEYYRIARVTVEKIPDNSCYYKDMLRFHRKIFSQRETLIRQEMKSLIQASYYMWYLLLEWNSYDVNHGDLRVAHRYEDILYDFVGAWESWPMYIEPRSKRTGDISHVFPAFIEHLEATASTAISALRFGNFEAAGWGIDMLNHWFEKLSTDNHWNAEFHWRTVLINIYLLPIETSSDIWQLILNNNAYNYNAAFDLSFKNAHLDLRVITACYILLKPGNEQSKLLVKYVRALLSGERIHPSGLARQCRNKISNAGDVLGVYIRHRDYRQNDNNSYGNWLSSILESFGRIYEEKRVSGRMYSGWSANDPQSMNRAYVEIAISMSSTLWKLSRNWEEAIFSGFFGHMEQKRIISDLNDWINIANTEHNYILVNPDVLDVHKTNFIKSIEDIINSIKKAQIKVIIDAEIDQDQLVRLGGEISKNLDNHYLNKFPLVFFENFERRTELSEDSSYKVNVPNVSKAWVASGINANLELHEDSWMVDFISENIKERVFIPLQTYPKSASHKYTDMDSFLSAIRKNAESMACPVMFVGDEIFGEKLRQLSYEPNVIDRDGIIHQDGFDTQYICHVGNCEVYSINSNYFDYCLLTSKELFDTISMREIADDRYVDVNFKLNDDSETTGILEFKYYMKIKLSHEIPCIKFLLEIADDNSA
ncbi:TPA: hypothetical protein SIA31_002036 [Aeromonas sobria]|nr:hypothetical protein [Aeromonas sobria]